MLSFSISRAVSKSCDENYGESSKAANGGTESNTAAQSGHRDFTDEKPARFHRQSPLAKQKKDFTDERQRLTARAPLLNDHQPSSARRRHAVRISRMKDQHGPTARAPSHRSSIGISRMQDQQGPTARAPWQSTTRISRMKGRSRLTARAPLLNDHDCPG
jgi:hypothetical protein